MDRETTIEYMRKAVACHNENPADCLGRNCCDCSHDYPVDTIESLEPADVVPVVRCDDCKYYGSRRWCELHSSVFDDNAFCSYGERKE